MGKLEKWESKFHGGPKEGGGDGATWAGVAQGEGQAPDVGVSPIDELNARLLDNVRPLAWQDPEPAPRYNLVVVGAGASGLVSAAGAAGVGGRVALIEESLLGGDCLNVGCVPSKALIRCAKAVHEVRCSEAFGVEIDGTVRANFGKVMQRMRRLRAQISKNDSAERFTSLGVDVFQGRAKFNGPESLEVNGKTLKFSAAVVATGGRAAVPPIKGLKDVPYLTNASLFNLTELPPRLAVIGGGPIGMELAQAMCRFGSEVTVLDIADRVLLKEERDAADIVLKQVEADGVKFKLPVGIQEVSRLESGEITMSLDYKGSAETLVVDAVLVATGRVPNVEGMGLEVAGIKYDKRTGIEVNDFLQTTNKRVFAAGDVCTLYRFTHVGDSMARTVVRNALFFGRGKMSSLLIPWCTYTEPEIAHVGKYEHELDAAGVRYQKFRRDLADVDRAILDGADEGYVTVLTKEGSDQILGATVVAADAGNMISEVTVAMQAGMGLGALASVIHPYPTQAEAIRQCGDQYNRTRLTPVVKTVFNAVLSLKRR
ncbi:unnamed protein product [Ostreobium quekettii]|uniref:Mercuric reductase n=1 Tax=Ostreobium quekettii TaxID=121088 RepID=A0A8S1IQC0_9CHLO|nr:unnamed protein product [Ostreobium quekettii]|eukprot:evm.model.scf_1228.4 EVM.evm.TU.scf_1228.4   scf_1228:36616-47680(-)